MNRKTTINWKNDESISHRVHSSMIDTCVCVPVCACVYVIYIYLCMCIRRKNHRSRTPRDFDARKRFQPAFPRESNAPPRSNRDKVHPSFTLSRLSHPRRVLYKVSSPAQSSCPAATSSSRDLVRLAVLLNWSDSSEMMPLGLCESSTSLPLLVSPSCLRINNRYVQNVRRPIDD